MPWLDKDDVLGIELTPEEIAAHFVRVREELAECQAIIDELFPEAEALRKPEPAINQQERWS